MILFCFISRHMCRDSVIGLNNLGKIMSEWGWRQGEIQKETRYSLTPASRFSICSWRVSSDGSKGLVVKQSTCEHTVDVVCKEIFSTRRATRYGLGTRHEKISSISLKWNFSAFNELKLNQFQLLEDVFFQSILSLPRKLSPLRNSLRPYIIHLASVFFCYIINSFLS